MSQARPCQEVTFMIQRICCLTLKKILLSMMMRGFKGFIVKATDLCSLWQSYSFLYHFFLFSSSPIQDLPISDTNCLADLSAQNRLVAPFNFHCELALLPTIYLNLVALHMVFLFLASHIVSLMLSAPLLHIPACFSNIQHRLHWEEGPPA